MTQLDEEITVQTLKSLRASHISFTLIDVREPWEVELATIAESMCCPMKELLTNGLVVDPSTPIVLYCHRGIRSRNAAIFLKSRGFENVASLKGGIDAWAREIDPSVPLY